MFGSKVSRLQRKQLGFLDTVYVEVHVIKTIDVNFRFDHHLDLSLVVPSLLLSTNL